MAGAGCDTGTDEPEPLAVEWSVPYQEFPRGLRLDPLISGERVLTAVDGWVTAREVADGAVAWQHPWPTERLNGDTEWTTDGEAVFIASAEHNAITSRDIETGETNWQGFLPPRMEFLPFLHGAVDDEAVYLPAYGGGGARYVARFARADGRRLGDPYPLDRRVAVLRRVGSALVVGQAWGGTDDMAGAVLGLDPATGAERWRYEVEPGTGGFSYAPLWAEDGRVWAGTALGDGVLVCLDAETGAVVWERRGVNAFESELAVTPEGLRLFVNDGSIIRAFDAETGAELWTYEIDGHGQANLAYAGGVVYHGHSGALFAFDAVTGEELAVADPPGSVFDVEADAEAGRLYVLTGGSLEARRLLPPR